MGLVQPAMCVLGHLIDKFPLGLLFGIRALQSLLSQSRLHCVVTICLVYISFDPFVQVVGEVGNQ